MEGKADNKGSVIKPVTTVGQCGAGTSELSRLGVREPDCLRSNSFVDGLTVAAQRGFLPLGSKRSSHGEGKHSVKDMQVLAFKARLVCTEAARTRAAGWPQVASATNPHCK